MALHLMTMNLQLLPWGVETAVQGMTNRAEEKAERIVNDLLALPANSRPQVIAFNEVFDDEGRATLISGLKSFWPHITKKISGLRLDDSGLIVFSVFPFVTLPDGSDLYQEMFSDADGFDQLTAKSFGIVKVDAPLAGTTIIFTHMQASSDEVEDEFSEVRAKQFKQIFNALGEVLEDDGHLGRVVLMGDLNVRGDKGATAGEWATLFGKPPVGKPFGPLLDGWRTFMLPPGSPVVIDEGYTQRNVKTGLRQRLDYMCFCRPGHADFRLVPHRMFIRFNQQSDHFGLEGIVALTTANCTPSDAIDLLAVPGNLQSPTNPSTVRSVVLNFPIKGGYQWVYLRKPGTFSIWPSKDDSFDCFAVSDMSTPLSRLDSIRWRDLPPSISYSSEKLKAMNPRGEVFASREPFFIALRRIREGTGTSSLTVIEHAGECPATAIGLELNGSVNSTFPIGQTLGLDDTCWFKATIAPLFTNLPRSEVFSVTNPGNLKLTVEVQDDRHAVLHGANDSVDTVRLEAPLSAMPLMHLTLKRANQTVNGFKVSWTSPASFLRLDMPIHLHVDDETSVDHLLFVNPSDEPSLQINMDGDPFQLFSGTWDDADTGEEWPNLDQAIRGRIQQRFPGVTRIGFVQDISISYVEPDVAAQGWRTKFVPPLSPGEWDEVERRVSLPVQDDLVADGRYTFSCTLSRFPA